MNIEIDARETCLVSVSEKFFTASVVRLIEPNVWVSCFVDPLVVGNTLRLGKDFARSIGLVPGQSVSLQSTGGIPVIATAPLMLSPASVEDWEVIESMASFLEGTILEQVRIISPNMTFPIWVVRGQKPVFLKHSATVFNSSEYYLLGPATELAIEQRMRRKVVTGNQRKNFPLRVALSVHDHVGVGFIVHESDFTSTSGCIVTVRDRPELVALVACDSTLCDPGVVMVSRLLRSKYGLSFGTRIVIEEYDSTLGNSLIVPSSVSLSSESSSVTGLVELFKAHVTSAKALVVPQGGWVGPLDPAGIHYVQVRFPMGPERSPNNAVALLTSTKDLDINVIENARCTILDLQQPFLKYLPENIVHDSKLFGLINDKKDMVNSVLPSFEAIVASMNKYIESCFLRANPELSFVGSAVVLSPHEGAGSTTVALQVIQSLDPPVPHVTVNCALLSDASRYKLSDVTATISGLIRFAFESPPMIVFFDRVDLLIPPSVSNDAQELTDEEGNRTKKRGIFLAAFLENLIAQLRPNRSIFLLATAVDDSIRLANLFVHAERLPRDLTEKDRSFLANCFAKTVPREKYVLSELVELLKFGVDNHERRKQLMTRSNVAVTHTACTLGGMDDQIAQLVDAITLPLEHPYLFTKQTQTTGALIVGPTGCGKSALVDHVVRKTKLPVEIVRGPDLLDKYIGASEAGVRRVFEKAASVAPSILVFDTVDALCPRRGIESTGVTDRVVNQMLCYLDGVEKVEGVFVIAITSRPDMVDPALTRPGRLDMVVVCDIPTKEQKLAILQACCTDAEQAGLDIDLFVDMLHPNCSGADIRGAFVNAQIALKKKPEENFSNLLKFFFEKVKPSISEADRYAVHDVGVKAVLH